MILIEHFLKLAEESCDLLITQLTSRYRCPMTFQSDNEKAFFGDLTKVLMKISHVAQAHTIGMLERQIITLVNMLRVNCSMYMTG